MATRKPGAPSRRVGHLRIFPKPTVNLSVGFNQEHTANETLKLSSCRNTYNNIQKILTDLEELSFNDLRRENKWGSSYESYGRGGGRSTYGGSSYIDDTWEDDDYYDHPNIKPPFYLRWNQDYR